MNISQKCINLAEPKIVICPGQQITISGLVPCSSSPSSCSTEGRFQRPPPRLTAQIDKLSEPPLTWRGTTYLAPVDLPNSNDSSSVANFRYSLLLEHAWFDEGDYSLVIKLQENLTEEDSHPSIRSIFRIDRTIDSWISSCTIDLYSVRNVSGYLKLAGAVTPETTSWTNPDLTNIQLAGRIRAIDDIHWKTFSSPALFLSTVPLKHPGYYFEQVLPFSLEPIGQQLLEIWIEPSNIPMQKRARGGVSTLLISSSEPTGCGLYGAEFSVRSPINVRDLLLQLSGTVKNSGKLAWSSNRFISDHSLYITVSVIQKTTGESVSSYNIELEATDIFPEDTAHFSAEIDISKLESGDYSIEFDIVRRPLYQLSVRSQTPKYSLNYFHCKNDEMMPADCLARPPEFTNIQGRTILYLAPEIPLFNRSAGGKRTLSILELLKEQECRVSFYYDYLQSGLDRDQGVEALANLGVVHEQGTAKALSKIQANEFDVVIIAWWQHAEKYVRTVKELLPNARVIIDSVDLHWVRESRGVASGLLTLSDEMLTERKAREVATYKFADTVWVVSEQEKQYLQRELPSCSIRQVSLIEEVSVTELSAYPTSLLFVGGFHHPPNIDAALAAIEITHLLNRDRSEKLCLDIIGEAPPETLLKHHDNSSIRVWGHVNDLKAFYAKQPVLLAPLQYGGGVKGKIVEAAANGLVIVTSAIGNEGIGLVDNDEAFICETSDDYSGALNDIFNQRVNLQAIKLKAQQRISRIFNKTAARVGIETSIVCRPVTIAIVSYNGEQLLRRCLESVIARTRYPNFRIAVLSNGCSDGTRNYLKEVKRRSRVPLDIFAKRVNEFFVLPNNLLIESYPNDDLLLLNNDVEIITEDWLWRLYDAAYSSPLVAAAGGLIIGADGKVSEAGAILNAQAFGRNLNRGCDLDAPAVCQPGYVGYCSGCMLYLKRSAIQTVGVLDTDYSPMYFEDVDWQYRAHSQGLKTAYSPFAKIVHYEGSSAGVSTDSGLKEFQEINRHKFLAKFSDIDICALNT